MELEDLEDIVELDSVGLPELGDLLSLNDINETSLSKAMLDEKGFEKLAKSFDSLHRIKPIDGDFFSRKDVYSHHVMFDGEYFDSEFEATFYAYMKYVERRAVVRNHEGYVYYRSLDNKTHKYFYDFIVNGQLCECKGKLGAKDTLKLNQHPEIKLYMQKDCGYMYKEVYKLFPDFKKKLIPMNS